MCMICFPNAKINLGLHITGKRPDGYHSIESVFYPVPLTDALEVVVSEKTTFTQTGVQLGIMPDDNLVMKAYALMAEKYKLPAIDIYLKKAIPSGAGLGGGSADAAFMLKLLCEFYKLPASEQHLLEMAAILGADCPFFIHNKPLLATGFGNIFQPCEVSLKGYVLCIVKPPFSISTKEAYSGVIPKKPDFSLQNLSALPVFEWKTVLKNDFEPNMVKRYPFIGRIKDDLYAMGAEYASMTGSGSAVYGIFKNTVTLFKNTVTPLFHDCFVWQGILG